MRMTLNRVPDALTLAIGLLAGAPFLPGSQGGLQGQDSPRIITVGAAVTETVFALGVGDGVVAVDDSSLFPADVASLPQVGYLRTLSIEGILSLSPDLVIASSESGPPLVLSRLREAGVRLETIETAKQPRQIPDMIRSVAGLLGRQEAGEALAAEVELDLDAVESARRLKGDRARAVFIWSRGSSTLSVAGRDTGAHTMLTFGGIPNAAESLAGYQPLSPEAMLLADPEALIVPRSTSEALGGIQAILATPGVAATQAGRRRAVVPVDLAALIGFGPRAGKALLALMNDLDQVAGADTVGFADEPVLR